MIHIIPNQMFGIGDIIFCQTLVHKIANENPIIWGVYPQFVEGLRRAYPHIDWRDYRDMPIDWNRQEQFECDVKGIGKSVVLPIRFAGEMLKLPYNETMRAKYQLYGLDWETWRDKAMWVTDLVKSHRLYDEVVKQDYDKGIKEFNVVNRTFGSDGKMQCKIPKIENEVLMTTIGGYSIFDWCETLIRASKIHTVSSSIIYLLEMMEHVEPKKFPEIHLYNRPIAGQGFANVDYILTKHKYIFHE